MKNLKKLLLAFAMVAPSWSGLFAYEVTKKTGMQEFVTWKEVYSESGCCKASFPQHPKHMQQDMQMKGGDGTLRYDVYVADHQKKEVFMVLIAKYPAEIRKEDAKQNLEHFLNTLITQNPNNRLLFAEEIEVQGNVAMDFFIRTDSVYFKGRVIQTNNSLYLLAMECPIVNYQEHHFNFFIESFSLQTTNE